MACMRVCDSCKTEIKKFIKIPVEIKDNKAVYKCFDMCLDCFNMFIDKEKDLDFNGKLVSLIKKYKA